VINAPSIFKLIRKTVSLTRMTPTFAFTCGENFARRKWKVPLVGSVEFLSLEKNGQFPDETVRIKSDKFVM
jgi:hypothetical protein